MKSIQNCLAATAVIAALGGPSISFADDAPLPKIDSLLTTFIDKSVVAGAIATDPQSGAFLTDPAGNYMFNYSGAVYSVDTNERTGRLKKLEKAVGTVVGQAAFPQAFADLAMAAYSGNLNPATIPPVIDWTCNHCKLVIGKSTFESIVDANSAAVFPPAGDPTVQDAMRLKGRAFTGLGPVELNAIAPGSMSIRMAGCSAIVGTDGPDKGKVGTICLNGTFTFDLAGLAQGQLTGTGTSNCITVLHTPMQM